MTTHPTAGRVLVTTLPFGEIDRAPLRALEAAGVSFDLNPLGRRLKEPEIADLIGAYDALIAGTEPITAAVLARATRLRLIARVGIGLDSVDLNAARARGIAVTYTPDAPAPAVAELTVGLMISALRSIGQADRVIRARGWRRFFGRRLSECTVGVIGVGRAGTRVIRHLAGFGCSVLANDIKPNREFERSAGIRWVEKDTIYRECDVITLHVPLTRLTRGMIAQRELALMRPDAVLVNTSRGGMIDERALSDALRGGRLGAAALDVFEREPYSGELAALDNCILTSHIGSMSIDCRARMEREATEEVVRLFSGQPPAQPVPDEEYENAREAEA